MDRERLYEKVKECKSNGDSDVEIIVNLYNDDVDLFDLIECIDERNMIEIEGKKLLNYVKSRPHIYMHDEYGIPMIDRDEDW